MQEKILTYMAMQHDMEPVASKRYYLPAGQHGVITQGVPVSIFIAVKFTDVRKRAVRMERGGEKRNLPCPCRKSNVGCLVAILSELFLSLWLQEYSLERTKEMFVRHNRIPRNSIQGLVGSESGAQIVVSGFRTGWDRGNGLEFHLDSTRFEFQAENLVT
jgi:hypothetical protein